MSYEKFIEDIYRSLPDEEKLILKDMINDIILISNVTIPKEKSIHIIRNSDFIEKASNIFEKQIQKELMYDEVKELTDDIMNINKNSRSIFIAIYKNHNFKYIFKKSIESIFVIRKDLLRVLHDFHILDFTDFKSLGFNNFDDFFKENHQMKNLTDKFIQKNIDEYWDDIIKNDLTFLNNMHVRVWVIHFEKDKIIYLENLIKQEDSKYLTYTNWGIIFQWKVIYTPKKTSDRKRFLDLFFSKEKNTYMTFKEIINYLEAPAPAELTHKNTKRIYDLKDDLNKIIADNTKLTKFFELWKWLDTETIYRKY